MLGGASEHFAAAIKIMLSKWKENRIARNKRRKASVEEQNYKKKQMEIPELKNNLSVIRILPDAY